MISISSNTNGFTVEGIDNKLYPDNGTLVFASNTVIMAMDESDMVTFRSAANNDVLFSGIIGQIEIGGVTVTKQNIVAKFNDVANTSSGGGGSLDDYYTKEEVNALIPTEVSELTNDAGYITQEQVIINESFPSGWHTTGTMSDLITDINNDSDALVGKVYMGTVSFSDLPSGLMQAELQVEIMSEMEGIGKVLVFTVTSSNTSPYHWEYTSAYGSEGTWRSWATSTDIADFFDGAEYDSQTKRINFKHGNTVKAYIDATAFIKDGMVDTVEISNGNLVITFNTDAGKQPISIPLTDIFNPSNYYDKTAADARFAQISSLATVATSGSYNDLSNKPTIPAAQVNSDWSANSGVAQILNKPDLSIYAESANLATVATSGSYNDLTNTPTIPAAQVNSDWNASSGVAQILNKPDLSVYAQSSSLATVATSGDYDDLQNKPTIPTVPTNVSAFTNDAGYLTQHQSLTEYYTKTQSDARYVDKTTFDTKEEVISSALNDLDSSKQDTLVSGTNIKTINNQSILGSGNITIQGGGGTQVQSDWSQSDSSAVDYIKNKPDLTVYAQSANLATVATSGSYNDLSNKPTIPDTSDFVSKTEYNPKEIAIANALNDLNANKADKSEIPDVSSFVTASSLATVATSGSYNDLSNKPTIPDTSNFVTKTEFDIKEEVISTALNDLNTGKQDVLTAGSNITITNNVISATGGGGTQVQSDWSQSDNTAVDYIKNKPDLSVYAQSSNLATVATSGSYTDLSNKPTIPTVPTNVSDFTNDAGYITSSVNNLTYYYTKSEIDATVGNINSLLEAI